MGEIAKRLPKTVHLDEVTAGNILDRLRTSRARTLASFVSSDGSTDVLDAVIEPLDEEINALANAMQEAKFEAGRRAMAAAAQRGPTRRHVLHACREERDECQVCSGGLAFCTVCRGAEATLPRDCPGVPLSEEQERDIAAGRLDYVNGAWKAAP